MNRILHISKYYYPYEGGIEDVCYNIVKFLQQKDEYKQFIFCFNNINKTVDEIYDDIPIVRVAINGIIASQPIAFSYKKELLRVINDFKPDVVHFHVPNPFAAYYILKILPPKVKLIIHWHSDIIEQKVLYYFIKSLECKILERADLILATSPNYLKFSKLLQQFAHKVQVLQNIIDPYKFELTQQRLKCVEDIKSQYGSKPIVLFVGRHVPYKGLQFLIEAAGKIVGDCAIVIGGKGPMTAKLKRTARNLNNVYFIGRIPDENLAAYFYAADVFVFPSITKNEAFGVALVEAMYCETPAVTFTIEGSGVNWVNSNGETGFEVENSNSEALGKAIDILLQDESLRKRMARCARKRVEQLFLINKVSDKIIKIYQ